MYWIVESLFPTCNITSPLASTAPLLSNVNQVGTVKFEVILNVQLF
jgi:hypothetical protein